MPYPYLSYADAREFVQALGFSNTAEFRVWATGGDASRGAKPGDIPATPHQVYGKEFEGYSIFLGTANVAPYNREFASFMDARNFVRGLGLESSNQFKLYCQGSFPSLPAKPDWLPTNPNLTYRDLGWAGMRDFLGTGDPVPQRPSSMRKFGDARDFARSLKLKSWLEGAGYGW